MGMAFFTTFFTTDAYELMRNSVVITYTSQEELDRVARAKKRRASDRKLGWYERAFATRVESIKDAYAREQAVRAAIETLAAQDER